MSASGYDHFDPQALLADLFDSVETVRSVLCAFENWHGVAQKELQAAAEAGDPVRLASTMHRLRGTLGQLHAARAVKIAQALEQRCKAADDNFQPGHTDIEPLQQALQSLADEIAGYLTER